ncbi:MAG: hypothetical protein JWO53_510 [Chlamydiia bacterium]|nr:hypothetical protein [Chlamydiia bacterium]
MQVTNSTFCSSVNQQSTEVTFSPTSTSSPADSQVSHIASKIDSFQKNNQPIFYLSLKKKNSKGNFSTTTSSITSETSLLMKKALTKAWDQLDKKIYKDATQILILLQLDKNKGKKDVKNRLLQFANITNLTIHAAQLSYKNSKNVPAAHRIYLLKDGKNNEETNNRMTVSLLKNSKEDNAQPKCKVEFDPSIDTEELLEDSKNQQVEYVSNPKWNFVIQPSKKSNTTGPDSNALTKTQNMQTARDCIKVGQTYLFYGMVNEARYFFQEALSINPDDYESHTTLGVIFLLKQDFIVAEAHLLKALTIKPNYTTACFELASLRRLQGNYEKAIIHLKTLLTIDENYPNAKKIVEELSQMVKKPQ